METYPQTERTRYRALLGKWITEPEATFVIRMCQRDGLDFRIRRLHLGSLHSPLCGTITTWEPNPPDKPNP